MELTEKTIENIKEGLKPILARFASDVKEINIVIRHNESHFIVTTNKLHMSPCVYKSLCISGGGSVYSSGITVALHWQGESYGGRTDLTRFCTIDFSTSENFEVLSVKNIRFD